VVLDLVLLGQPPPLPRRVRVAKLGPVPHSTMVRPQLRHSRSTRLVSVGSACDSHRSGPVRPCVLHSLQSGWVHRTRGFRIMPHSRCSEQCDGRSPGRLYFGWARSQSTHRGFLTSSMPMALCAKQKRPRFSPGQLNMGCVVQSGISHDFCVTFRMPGCL
jgi:hypothetical protein